MGNNSDPRPPENGLPQQVITNNNNNNQHKPRARGLMPTEGQDAYRSMRASKRSRNDRLSYLVATGHVDPEETEQLHKPIGDLITTVPELYSDSPSTTTAPRNAAAGVSNYQISDNPSLRPQTSLKINTKRSNFDPSFLNNLNHTLANSPVASNSLLQQQHNDFQPQENIFGSSLRKGNAGKKKPRKQKSSLYTSRKGASNHIRGGNIYTNQNDNNSDRKFRQTFTEVTLPMKTSPAFEYILRDNERRNKRCCLWFLYSTLVTICIAIILFCSAHLLLRSHTHS